MNRYVKFILPVLAVFIFGTVEAAPRNVRELKMFFVSDFKLATCREGERGSIFRMCFLVDTPQCETIAEKVANECMDMAIARQKKPPKTPNQFEATRKEADTCSTRYMLTALSREFVVSDKPECKKKLKMI